MVKLRFSEDLPEGAQISNDSYRNAVVNKSAVMAECRSNPGKWALTYEDGDYKLTLWWRKQDGFECAYEYLPNQENVKTSFKRCKIWVRYVGVSGQPEPQRGSVAASPPAPVADESEPLPANGLAPGQGVMQTGVAVPPSAPSAPAPLPRPPAITPPPRTAFQQAWDESGDSNPTFE